MFEFFFFQKKRPRLAKIQKKKKWASKIKTYLKKKKNGWLSIKKEKKKRMIDADSISSHAFSLDG